MTTQMRKVTLFVPADLMDRCQKITGGGVSETLRTALQEMAHGWARRELMQLQGKIDLEADGLTLAKLREMDDDSDEVTRAA